MTRIKFYGLMGLVPFLWSCARHSTQLDHQDNASIPAARAIHMRLDELDSANVPAARAVHRWTDSMVTALVQASQLKPDSVSTRGREYGRMRCDYYIHGKIYKYYVLRAAKDTATSWFYSPGHRWALVREIYGGRTLFEGILYIQDASSKGQFYGLSVWYDKNGAPNEVGYRYRDEWIGTWISWKDSIETKSIHGDPGKLDSVLMLKGW